MVKPVVMLVVMRVVKLVVKLVGRLVMKLVVSGESKFTFFLPAAIFSLCVFCTVSCYMQKHVTFTSC